MPADVLLQQETQQPTLQSLTVADLAFSGSLVQKSH